MAIVCHQCFYFSSNYCGLQHNVNFLSTSRAPKNTSVAYKSVSPLLDIMRFITLNNYYWDERSKPFLSVMANVR